MSTTQVQDDGFHEIQLNGKQLVFLFMAATVVSVVIFLCGVLVGRGVKAERAAVTSDAGSGAIIQDAPPLSAPAAGQQTAASVEPVAVAPPAVQEDKFSYPDRLEDVARKETLKAAASTPPPAPIPVPKAAAPVAAVAPKEAKPESQPLPTPAAAAPTRGDGYAIQVAALREPGEADTIAKRLVSKGYDAYVLTPPGGTPNVYRVRVGSFKTRRDAEPLAAKLQQEEQFKPWITR